MKKKETGRTLIETLSILCLVGIFSVSCLKLYEKVMNTIRANYVMQQVFIKANELMENKVAIEHNHKLVVLGTPKNNHLSYGYSFCALDEECRPKRKNNEIIIRVNGYFPVSLCNVLKKKIKTQEYAGLKNIKADQVDLAPTYHNECPTDDDILSMTFIMDSEFKEQTF